MNVPFASRIAAFIRVLDERVWPEFFYRLNETVRETLRDAPVIIADVGAAGGPDPRWAPAGDAARFVVFEPDARSQALTAPRIAKVFTTGLAAAPGRQTLHLTRLPQASSIYEINAERMDDFAIREWLEVVGRTDIELDTLDACFADAPHLAPDFIKIDVEGADLDVLRGGARVIERHVMGVQVETSFLERHRRAPLFGEIDAHLRARGFDLFHLACERWTRRNLVHGANSRPQVVWADAVYFLSRPAFLDRLAAAPADRRAALTAKFLVALLAYGAHDYALEIVEATASLIPRRVADALRQCVLESVESYRRRIAREGAGFVFALVAFIVALPLTPARRRAAPYLKRRAGALFHTLYRASARAGVANACLADPH
jgi:FkbM family methyltransferase